MENFFGYFIMAMTILICSMRVETKLESILDKLRDIHDSMKGGGNGPEKEPVPTPYTMVEIRGPKVPGKVVSIEEFKRGR